MNRVRHYKIKCEGGSLVVDGNDFEYNDCTFSNTIIAISNCPRNFPIFNGCKFIECTVSVKSDYDPFVDCEFFGGTIER